MKFKYSIEQILEGLKKKRFGGVCLVNLTANGETLLYRDIVSLTKGLLAEGHYVEIVTNGLAKKRIEEILALDPKLLRRLFFKISYHYEQIHSRGLVDLFWGNVEAIRKSPCSFTLELMPNDKIVRDISCICEECIDRAGALCHATVGRDDTEPGKGLLTKMDEKGYADTWNILDSKMFEFKMKLLGVKRREFCYAGKWSLMVNLANGEAYQCYGRPANQNIFNNPKSRIHFVPVGFSCFEPFCFNGHSHLSLGMIPELDTPHYDEIRDRECVDGTSWLKQDCKDFFGQKLKDNNKEYNIIEKILISVVNPFYLVYTFFFDFAETRRRLIKYKKTVTGVFSKNKRF